MAPSRYESASACEAATGAVLAALREARIDAVWVGQVPCHDQLALVTACEEAGITCAIIGAVGGDTLKFVDVEEWEADRFDGLSEIALADIRRAHEAFLPELMGADGALA